MEQISHKVTAKEFDSLSKNLQLDMGAVFAVVHDEVQDELAKLKRGDITPAAFIKYVENL